jgi:MFS family permease
VRDFVRYAVLTFVPLFAVRTLDASFAAAGSLIAIQGLAYVVVSPFVGAISSRVSNRVALVFALVLSSVGVALFPVAGSLAALGMLVGCYSVGDAIFSPVIKDTLTRSTTVEHRSGIIGGMQLLKFAAQSASPVAFGIVLAVAGFATVFPLAGVIAAVYALAVLVSLELSPAVAER